MNSYKAFVIFAFCCVAVQLTWVEAKHFCLKLGLRLLSIETAEENTALLEYIGENYPNYRFWTSGSNLYHPTGKFYWDSTGEMLGFTNWFINQPDNQGGSEYCLEMPSTANHMWNDIECTFSMDFICEAYACP
ncbi:Hypothetical predicted protein [Cloeon dipterum]|uniref:C-type lectin domain-containing protein n=1 Tax=Cloeon dipterum TaxID=197152 RepID=A0A8S1BR32_9INSE|nr:Hypothetical predicted protein [Cloeon dipterum]